MRTYELMCLLFMEWENMYFGGRGAFRPLFA